LERTATKSKTDASNRDIIIEHFVIVAITSSHGLRAQAGFPASAASSHGIVRTTKTVGMGFASSGVCVDAVCAGHLTLEGDEGDRKTLKRLLEVIPKGRLIEAEEITSAALRLLDDGAAAVTGLAILVGCARRLCHY
jgi:NAD(P)-dependent dehydrogenase (short-subunit alcohol dehydrogenase family)